MGVSIYYSAYRDSRLTDEELQLVEDIADEETEELLAEIGKHLPAWKKSGAVPGDVESPGEIPSINCRANTRTLAHRGTPA